MTKIQWTLLTFSGIIIVLGVNIWAAKRDHKLLEIYTQSEPTVYKQLPVIPFTNEQL